MNISLTIFNSELRKIHFYIVLLCLWRCRSCIVFKFFRLIINNNILYLIRYIAFIFIDDSHRKILFSDRYFKNLLIYCPHNKSLWRCQYWFILIFKYINSNLFIFLYLFSWLFKYFYLNWWNIFNINSNLRITIILSLLIFRSHFFIIILTFLKISL